MVVVDTMDRLADTEPGRLAALEMLRRAGVRLLVARDGTDTADPVGAGLVASLLTRVAPGTGTNVETTDG